ncbi:M4 family peptidase [Pseudonocardiaceae bacterium YIM PH 21723]|nr:M4 family peptidase [Pseudonocardiaceae bacterium YIM PH 21723]
MSPASSLRRPALYAGLAAALLAAVVLYPTAADNFVSTQSVAAGTDMKDVRTVTVGGVTVKRTQQYIDGVPVYGGELVTLGNTQPLGKVAKASQGRFPATAKVTSGKQVWFDPSLFGKPGAAAVPAYQMETSEGTAIVDAASGAVLLKAPKEKEAVNRAICDLNNQTIQSEADYACGGALEPVLTEEGGQGEADASAVFKFFGSTSEFYEKEAKFDLTQNIGANGALRGTVRICVPDSECPFANAFWDGTQMAFGQGLSTIDITAHELTHGVTEHTSNLVYQGESGALNEAMSDIFGAFVNQANGATGASKWAIGEGSALGVIRDMANPPAHQQPDTYSKFVQTTGDNGGVHTNSGIANKLAFLVTDGENFGGQDIKGIGSAKAIQLFWLVENTLTSSSDYKAFGQTVNAACKQLAGSGTLTEEDCTQVANATKAVEIA